MKELEEKLQYRFRDPSLLRTALTHSSYINEHSREQAVCYERLEFLGDAVLGLTAAKLLYDWTPALPEARSSSVRRVSAARLSISASDAGCVSEKGRSSAAAGNAPAFLPIWLRR